MEKMSLTALARRQLAVARNASSGRDAQTVYGGHEHALRQTLIAIAAGHTLIEHDGMREATLFILQGRVRLSADGTVWLGAPGDLLIMPSCGNSLDALEDSAVLLTVAKSC
ncbi:MAG: LuxR family transcriptional regulator [Nakamurella sp.]